MAISLAVERQDLLEPLHAAHGSKCLMPGADRTSNDLDTPIQAAATYQERVLNEASNGRG